MTQALYSIQASIPATICIYMVIYCIYSICLVFIVVFSNQFLIVYVHFVLQMQINTLWCNGALCQGQCCQTRQYIDVKQ